jgi:putative FmdB family regulatory protein
MPIYEYECRSCGKRTEVLQRFADAPPAACPVCGGPVKKLISSPAFQFKGSGWYKTDYAAKKGGGEDKSEGKAEAKSEDKADSKSEGKTESKPAGESGKKEAVAASKPSGGSD